MRNKQERVEMAEAAAGPSVHSPLDLWRLMRGESHRVRERGKMEPAGMLAALGDRVTYTFILDDEVASIHFDRRRGEIFFKGHNIRHLELTDSQLGALEHMRGVLAGDPKAGGLAPEYSATLDRFLADNNKGRRASGAQPQAK